MNELETKLAEAKKRPEDELTFEEKAHLALLILKGFPEAKSASQQRRQVRQFLKRINAMIPGLKNADIIRIMELLENAGKPDPRPTLGRPGPEICSGPYYPKS